MSKLVRTSVSVVVSFALLTATAMARPASSHGDEHKAKSKEHHSHFAKLAFWHHHKDHHTNAKDAKHARPKHAQAKAVHTKPASQTAAASPKDHKPVQHASSKAPAKKGSSTTKAKPHDQDQHRTTAG